jgi:hypothetical protein
VGDLVGNPVATGVGTGPALLSYATPAVLAAAPTERMAPIQPDEGPFLKLGSIFNTGSGKWVGPVAASPKALYLLKRRKQMNSAYAHGSLIGMLVVAATESGDVDDTRTCTLAEIPPAVRQFLARTGKKLSDDVIVVPRETVSRIRVAAVNNTMSITAGGVKMTVNIRIFRNGWIKRWLTRQGWILNADMIPTAAPVFGQSFGRPEPLVVKKTHPLLRVLYVLLAILVFCLVVWIRLYGSGRL